MLNIAKEIYSQISYNTPVFWSWGGHAFKALPRGLEFKVNGMKHKGTVRIELTYSDTYNVSFIKNKKVTKSYTDIYCDQLLTLIDETVET